jgi:ribosomal protein S27AE
MINKALTTIDYLEYILADCFCPNCGKEQKLWLRKEHFGDIKISGNRAPIHCGRCGRMKLYTTSGAKETA